MTVPDVVQSRVMPESPVAVYVRRAADGGTPIDGGAGGADFVPAADLVCTRVDRRLNGLGGTATLRFVPLSSGPPSVEAGLRRSHIDDQVRVFVWPPDVAGVDRPQTPELLFDGVIRRQQFELQHDGQASREQLVYTALAWPAIDNDLTMHQVRGRWVAGGTVSGSIAQAAVIESPQMPATFNFRGRPNRASAKQFQVASGSAGFGYAALFTSDEDPGGSYWTVRAALRATLGLWLFGEGNPLFGDGALPRHVALDKDLQAALADDAPDDDPRFEGFDAVLAETDVSGLGVFDAVAKICAAAGLEMMLDCVPNELDFWDVYEGLDRTYALRIQRRGKGPRRAIALSPRRSTFATARDLHRRNEVTAAQAMLDGADLANEIDVYGEQFIECRVELKPRWRPDDAVLVTLNGDLARDLPTDADGDADPANQTDYQRRHVEGGAEYEQYARVGRLWGVHCLGSEAGYESGAYAKDPDGFDWVSELGLNDAPIAEDRQVNGVEDPIVWSNRVRPLLPLRSPQARANGLDYVLEISEDGGASWSLVDPKAVNVKILADQCAVWLNHKNLATVALRSLVGAGSGGGKPAVSDSWWGLIDSGDLRLRLHCSVPADTAARAFAPRRGQSRSRYPLGQTVATDFSETYVHPDGVFAAVTDPPAEDGADGDAAPVAVWSRIAGWGEQTTPAVPAPSGALLAAAERRRDALDAIAVSGSFRASIAHLRRWRLGDAVTRIAGREIDLSIDAAGERAPTIVGIRYELEKASQGVMLTLGDHRLIEGGDRLG